MPMKMTYKTPDKSTRKMNRVFRDAIDKGMLNHQKSALPRHFTTQAFVLYPDEYSKSASVNRFIAGKALQKKIAAMSMSEREAWKKERAEQAREKGSNRKQAQKIPLFQSGRLRSAVIEGQAQHIGALKRRSMVLNVPLYTYFNPKGQIHKAKAIQAVHSSEDEEFGKVIDQELDKYLN